MRTGRKAGLAAFAFGFSARLRRLALRRDRLLHLALPHLLLLKSALLRLLRGPRSFLILLGRSSPLLLLLQFELLLLQRPRLFLLLLRADAVLLLLSLQQLLALHLLLSRLTAWRARFRLWRREALSRCSRGRTLLLQGKLRLRPKARRSRGWQLLLRPHCAFW